MNRAPIVLGIAGSPRRHGNSDRLLDAALEGAASAGAETRLLVASQADLRPCLGCNACSLTGECVQRDGGPAFYRAIDAADAFLVASPVFFATVPAVLKIAYDRLQPYWARRYVLKRPLERRRPGGVLLVRSGGDPYGFVGADYATRSVLAVLGVDVLGSVKADGADGADALRERPEALDEARALGAAVATEALQRRGDGGS
jgi:multimeric flavodoxin WrbA